MILFSFGTKVDLGVRVASRPFFDRSPGVGRMFQGAIASNDRSTHYDINLFSNRLSWTRSMILFETPFRVDSLVLDITTEMPLAD
ncbi:hypothetical protein GW17_00025505 [Ensete ventricosum]|nr:hypothetical protein GW17_00025505 [Ensete ventricosum]